MPPLVIGRFKVAKITNQVKKRKSEVVMCQCIGGPFETKNAMRYARTSTLRLAHTAT